MTEEHDEEETTQEEVQTPTPEEQMAAIRTELTDYKAKLESTEKGLRTAHQTLTEKDKEIKRQANIETRLEELGERMELLATAWATSSGQSEDSLDTYKEQKRDVLEDLRKVKQDQDKKRKEDQLKVEQEEYIRNCDAIHARAKEVFADNEDAIFQVRAYLRSGDLDLAESKIAKAEVSKKTPTESSEARIERLAEEKARARWEKEDLLETDTGGPSASSVSAMDATEKYIKGQITAEEAIKRGAQLQ